MTFYEAALRVLEAAGQPLTFGEITERSVAQGLLSHVGKTPEQTMLSRLVAMARRARDRRVIVTGPDTFGLTEWSVPEDAAALEAMSQPLEHPEEGLPPLRPAERHPELRGDRARGGGPEGRRRRYPPISEVAFELLGEADAPLAPGALLALARERQLASDELQPEALLLALAEDNQRRIEASRRPHFALDAEGALTVEHDDAPVAEVQATFARALGLPFEEGRIRFRPGAAAPSGAPAVDEAVVQAAKSSVKDARRAMARVLRAHLASLEAGTLEKACVRMLHALGFREVKVAKRSKDGPLLTARRKEGSLELRWAVRVVRGGAPVERRSVQDCRREIGHHAAHLGLLLGTGDVRGEARAEALSGGPLVHLWSGEGLAEKFLEARTGVRVTTLELFELDRSFFEDAARDAEDARRRREERHRERESAAEAEGGPGEPLQVAGPEPEPGAAGEGEEEPGSAEPGASEGSPGERKRRRRRRGRRGRARPGAAGAAGAGEESGPPSGEGSSSGSEQAAPEGPPPPGTTSAGE